MSDKVKEPIPGFTEGHFSQSAVRTSKRCVLGFQQGYDAFNMLWLDTVSWRNVRVVVSASCDTFLSGLEALQMTKTNVSQLRAHHVLQLNRGLSRIQHLTLSEQLTVKLLANRASSLKSDEVALLAGCRFSDVFCLISCSHHSSLSPAVS